MLVPFRVSEFGIDHTHKDCPISHGLAVESEPYTSVKLAVDYVPHCIELGNQAWVLAIAFIKQTNVPERSGFIVLNEEAKVENVGFQVLHVRHQSVITCLVGLKIPRDFPACRGHEFPQARFLEAIHLLREGRYGGMRRRDGHFMILVATITWELSQT